MSHVYVIQLGDYYKIGRARDVEKRLRSLCPTKFPQVPQLKLSIAVLDAPFVEALLHSKYKDKQVRGEWFTLNAVDLVEIQQFITVNQHKVFTSNQKKSRVKALASERAKINSKLREDAMLRIRDFPAALRLLAFGDSVCVYGKENIGAIKTISRKIGRCVMIMKPVNLNGVDVFFSNVRGDTWELSLMNCWAQPRPRKKF